MSNRLTLLLTPLVSSLAGCPPTTLPPTPNPPVLSWTIRDLDAAQNLPPPSGQAHVPGGHKLSLSFLADAPGGLTAMTLAATGFVTCGASNNTGGNFTAGTSNDIGIAPQQTTFNPTVSSNSLLIIPFTFFQIDCHRTVQTDVGPREGFAVSPDTITLTGTATDSQNRMSTGQLQLVVP